MCACIKCFSVHLSVCLSDWPGCLYVFFCLSVYLSFCVCSYECTYLNMRSFYFLFLIYMNSEHRYLGCPWYTFNMENFLCNGVTSTSIFGCYHSLFYSYGCGLNCGVNPLIFCCWTLDVSRTASYEINLVRLSVSLSVCPSVHP